jgi:hypothetical protein
MPPRIPFSRANSLDPLKLLGMPPAQLCHSNDARVVILHCSNLFCTQQGLHKFLKRNSCHERAMTVYLSVIKRYFIVAVLQQF